MLKPHYLMHTEPKDPNGQDLYANYCRIWIWEQIKAKKW